MSLPLSMSKEEWLERLRPLNGQLIEVVGCAVSMRPTRQWAEGFVVWPMEHCRYGKNSPGTPNAGFVKMPRVIAVRLAIHSKVLAEEETLFRSVRVTGTLRLGDVRQGRLLESWADIEEAHAEVIPER